MDTFVKGTHIRSIATHASYIVLTDGKELAQANNVSMGFAEHCFVQYPERFEVIDREAPAPDPIRA